ncbi:MAG: hypothetical protein DMG07_00240 [Acidobacteria bacterium]|nr:MAG: hypothetical protein DMG07_00240 [Acidobacteriota bacterium]
MGSTFTDKLSREGGRLDRLIRRGASDGEIIEELYLAALSRFPTPQEVTDLRGAITRQPARRQALEELLWALVSSEEFSSNH